MSYTSNILSGIRVFSNFQTWGCHMRYLLFAVLAAFTFSSIADTPEETDATSGLPIWLLYQATVAAAACVHPVTPITNSNFNAAITDWFASGNASQYGDITKWCTGL